MVQLVNRSPFYRFGAFFSAKTRYIVRIQIKRVIAVIKSLNITLWMRGCLSYDFGNGTWLGTADGFLKLKQYFGIVAHTTPSTHLLKGKFNFYGFPMIGASKVPIYLDAVVDLRLGLDPILIGLGENVRRLIRRTASEYSIKIVDGREDVAAIYKLMLVPYGRSRHGEAAANLDEEVVHQLLHGRANGRLHILYKGEIAVGCHLGFKTMEKRGEVWNALRFGYVADVFDNPKILDEVNTINAYLAMNWASSEGYEFYNFGMSGGNLSNGLLRWKMRRGGVPDATRSVDFFYLKLENGSEPLFYWHSPTLILLGGELCLCIGQPEGVDLITLKSRYKGYFPEGLSSVRLYCASAMSGLEQRVLFAKYVQNKFVASKVRVFYC